MSRIVKVNGDYRLQVQSGGNIILDTTGTTHGNSPGMVTIYGNLDVKGSTTTVESTNTSINDNIIQLNYIQNGSTGGAGISSANSYQSGIEIERGSYGNARFVFNELVTFYDASLSANMSGAFLLQTVTTGGSAALNALQLRTIVSDTTADIGFDLQGSSRVLTIFNSGGTVGLAGYTLAQNATSYSNRVTALYVAGNYSSIPNVAFLQQYIASNYNGSGQGQATVNSLQYPITGSISAANSSIAASLTNIVFQIAGTTQVTIDSTGTLMGNVKVGAPAAPNTITNSTANNLILTTSNSSKAVEINAITQFDNLNQTVTYTSAGTQIYSSATVGPAKTGIYFTNFTNRVPDELISRNRAVLLSILL